jgi:hypothetical protein
MSNKQIFIGNKQVHFENKSIKGKLIDFDNESYYKISNSDAMRPFFMSIVSDSNHWMFISSNGGLTAGRKDAEYALFPYYTDDKITESTDITGSKTIFQVQRKGKVFIWEPFSDRYAGIYDIQRNLYKNTYGNKVIFEEINSNLGLTYRYQWNSSNQFGFVKKATIINNDGTSSAIKVLDGIQNIIPYGVSSSLQGIRSNLVDAYKRSELDIRSGLGIYALSAIIVDKAEPSEALKATIAWSLGFEDPTYLVSSLQVDGFRKGGNIHQEVDVKAEKGAYFVCSDLKLEPGRERSWVIVANVNQSISSINQLSESIVSDSSLLNKVMENVELGSKRLLKLNAAADGLQISADTLRDTRHFSNTLFNIMRGGIFDDNYQIEKADFVKYVKKANKNVYQDHEELFDQLPNVFGISYLRKRIANEDDSNLKRLVFEYMPLKFSRRHGDPSRPWNRFSINTTSEADGSKILDYEGNWRDIFQNWEALAHSYPEFLESMIHKFLNATTFDGYNPYRVTKDGFDWETIEPDDPWSYIGYWGDHQIIYLLKLLECLENHCPNKLADYFDQEVFVYANVPYKIKSYTEILVNPKDTIDFDAKLDKAIRLRRDELGADGALLQDKNSRIYKANLIEKILATVLAKISNFIPEAGIWMNTQRPEWNDANNALVGNGVSMVTLCYLRRFLHFFEDLLERTDIEESTVTVEIAEFFSSVYKPLKENAHILDRKVSDLERKTLLDSLGKAGSDFRYSVYNSGFSGDKTIISKEELLQFFKLSRQYMEHSMDVNKRADNLFHSYNLMTVVNNREVSISHLPEMLEGQVAALSSGYIIGKEALQLLDALKASALFRDDQYSYLLYPNKELPGFLDKNTIPSERIAASTLVKQLLKDGNTQILEKDILGNYHFNGNFNNADSLKEALSRLPKNEYGDLIEQDTPLLLSIFEEVFDHKSFTGRSGTFYGYEGLGSIYWHMVSKLLLSVQEVCWLAVEQKETKVTIGKLLEHYYEINEGIGVHKSPELYGAFPTDPYSHTPGGKGAQQPGMTGQVKEDVLSRFGELGVIVSQGRITFNPRLLRQEEFLKKGQVFRYIDINSREKEIQLEKDSLCFTYCQVPVIYKLAGKESLKVVRNEDSVVEYDRLSLDTKTSKSIFERLGDIDHIEVLIKK